MSTSVHPRRTPEALLPGEGPPAHLPTDWPGAGPIDVAIHDLPHRSSTTEWWYVNSHLWAVDGREFSLFASFFRLAVDQDQTTGECRYAHAVSWALIDAANKRYYANSVLDQCSPEDALQRLDRGEATRDPFLRRALREVFAKGRVPLPDRICRYMRVGAEDLDLDFDGNRLSKTGGGYQLELSDPARGIRCRLVFAPEKPIVRHGNDGVVRGPAGEDMFYYFTPRCRVEGELLVAGQPVAVAQATGWYDREFGRRRLDAEDSGAQAIGWNWAAVQLDNGCELSAYDLFSASDGAPCCHWAILCDPEGNRCVFEAFTLQPLDYWRSTRTFNDYPTRWVLDVPGAGLRLTIESEFEAQEFLTIISPPAFWEGRVRVAGVMGGRAVQGLGFLERRGFRNLATIDDFLAAVSHETRKAVDALLPADLTPEDATRLIASPERVYLLDGFDLDQYARTVIRPIREIIHRGGKAWRSYGLLAALDLAGGDSEIYRAWLAVPELLHVGSLIVDDVEDRSEIRRGGPSCHKLHGEALAINAGSACYFLGQTPMLDSNLTPPTRVRVYEAYFEAMRAAHAGQAADIDGLARWVPKIVESGCGELLERRVLAIYRLKAAAPPGALARMAAVVGGGTEEQVAGLGMLFEAFGLGFQIIDDVLDVRGFEGELKTRGEDISHGKITAPVAKSMSRLPRSGRRELWDALRSKPAGPHAIARVIDLLESCGAVDACREHASGLIEDAWGRLDPLFPDSQIKVNVRALGWYILDRRY